MAEPNHPALQPLERVLTFDALLEGVFQRVEEFAGRSAELHLERFGEARLPGRGRHAHLASTGRAQSRQSHVAGGVLGAAGEPREVQIPALIAAAGGAGNELDGQLDLLRHRAPGKLVEDQAYRRLRDALERLAHGRERRTRQARDREVVEAGHGNVARNAHAAAAKRFDGAEGHRVVADD